MTPEQELQFNSYGCIPRSLMKLAEEIQNPVTKQEFCERFGHRFQNPEKQYGLLNPDHIVEVACELNLPGEGGAQPKKLVWVSDYDQVAIFHQRDQKIMVVSQINLNAGATNPVGHCSVLHAIDDQSFTLWTSLQNGSEMTLPPFPRSAWAEKQCK